MGGYVGFLGYELKRELGFSASHHSPLPDAALLSVARLLVFDHELDRLYLVASGAGAEAWLDAPQARVAAVRPAPPPATGVDPGPVELSLRRSKAGYLADVERCLGEIHDGESYEVCLTNTLTTEPVARRSTCTGSCGGAARRPTPRTSASASCRCCARPPNGSSASPHGGEVTAKPVKGTAARVDDPEGDRRALDALLASVKDRAENLMIVDLLRNDLGRVCVPGTVAVPSLMDVESFATVHQLVSTVSGRLRPGLDAVDCVKAAFRAGR